MLNTNIDIKSIDNRYKKIVSNIINKKRISENEAILLLDNAPYHCLVLLQTLLDKKKIKIIHILTKIFTLNLQIFVYLTVNFVHIQDS